MSEITKTQSNPSTKNPQTLTGVVVGKHTPKTLLVRVDRRVKHRRYGKYLTRSKNYLAHSERTEGFKTGDTVTIRSSRPHSRNKHFEVVM